MSHPETGIATNPAPNAAAQMPGPDPALRKFDRFIGTWERDEPVSNAQGRRPRT